MFWVSGNTLNIKLNSSSVRAECSGRPKWALFTNSMYRKLGKRLDRTEDRILDQDSMGRLYFEIKIEILL